MSSLMNEMERRKGLYCTPPHIVKALLKRERFLGTIWEAAAGLGHIVKVLLECGYRDIVASDKNDWGFRPCRIEDFLTSTSSSDCIITNPWCKRKLPFLAQAKRLARHKIAYLLPVTTEYMKGFRQHELDQDFAWKAIYVFPQPIGWLNVEDPGGKMHFAWFVFERGYVGPVLREKIRFKRNVRVAIFHPEAHGSVGPSIKCPAKSTHAGK